MDLPLAVASLMKHPVPYVVLKPLIAALPVVWSEVPTARLVDLLIEGSAEINTLPDGKDRLAKDVLPRLSWTPELADAALEKAWRVIQGGTPHVQMSVAITTAVAPFASPEGRTVALTRAMRRSGFPFQARAELTGPLVETLLALGCSPNANLASPFLSAPSYAMFDALRTHGFSLDGLVNGQPLVEQVRERRTESFDSPSDRQKILASLPAVNLPVADKIVYLLGKAQRWTDVRNVLKEVGPDWVNLRFPDGDSVVSKVAERDPDWAVKLFALPAMKQAPLDIAIDGQGHHLIWSMVRNAELIQEAQRIDHPAWNHWVAYHTADPVSALTAILNEAHRYVTHHVPRQAVNVPTTTLANLAVPRYWPANTALEPLFEKLGTTLAQTRDRALSDPAFQAAFDRTVWNWPSAAHAYYAVNTLIQPLRSHNLTADAPFTLNLPKDLSQQDAVWIATHLLGDETGHLSLANDARFMKVFLGLIDHGANWLVLDNLIQDGRLAISDSDPHAKNAWYRDLHQHWESRQLREGLNDPIPASATPAVRRRL